MFKRISNKDELKPEAGVSFLTVVHAVFGWATVRVVALPNIDAKFSCWELRPSQAMVFDRKVDAIESALIEAQEDALPFYIS